LRGTFAGRPREVINKNCYRNLMSKDRKEPEASAFARLPRLAGRGLVALYRYTLSPLLGPRCRHLPTCSEYADEAIARFGLWAGGWMALARILRCHPWGTSGLDFVPEQAPQRARWWMPWRYGRWRGTNENAGPR
jgi:putative membrane protein insertion efficiency factor